MRKASPIFLIGCFCLYNFGYMLYFFAFEHAINKEWENNIYGDAFGNDGTELMEIPLSLPYMANQEYFQATNLSLEINGQFLRVIKQRYQNDTLQVIYTKDPATQKLQNQVADWIKSITDRSPENNQDRNHFFAKLFPKDFLPNQPYTAAILTHGQHPTRQVENRKSYTDILLSVLIPPPQLRL